MAWLWTLVAISTSFAAAIAFRWALCWRRRPRNFAWLTCSIVVALSPAIVPLSARPWRFLAALFAIAILLKLYDLRMQPLLAQRLTFSSYVLYLANWFWLVLRRIPTEVPANLDRQRLALSILTIPATLLPCIALFSLNFARWPFVLEHALKVSAVIVAIVVTSNAAASAWRLLIGPALDPMANPIAAPTPAHFWIRWNRPAQQFLHEYIYRPLATTRRPIPAILITFLISGLIHEYVFGIATGQIQFSQFLFFSLHALAATLTLPLHPRGRLLLPSITTTLTFNLASALLFFRDVNAIFPFYSIRAP